MNLVVGYPLPLLSPGSNFVVTSTQLTKMSSFIVKFSLAFTMHNRQKSRDTEKTNAI